MGQKLDFDISFNNAKDGFWPPIFESIPVFEKTLPVLKSGSCTFLRGLASFVELAPLVNSRAGKSTTSQAQLGIQNSVKLPKYHPYLSMRLRGVIHPIPPQPQPTDSTEYGDCSIPGWRRIVLVLYRPIVRHLIQVLEHAEEEFGDSFGTAITSLFTQNGTFAQTAVAQQFQAGTGAAAGANQLQVPDPAVLDARLNEYLRTKLAAPLWLDSSKTDKSAIEVMEEKYRLSEYLDWNDIDYAYAYEGCILPGGKIMMGRWWRLAMEGEGEGLEWSDALGMEEEEEDDGDGEAMDVDVDVDVNSQGGGGNGANGSGGGDGNESASGGGNGNGNGARTSNRHKKYERGPFVFWCQ